MSVMELVWGATLWGLWSCWLLAQHFRAPAPITRVSAGLLVAELVTLVVHGYACEDQGCGVAGSLAGTAASIDLPALAAVFVTIVVGREWLRARRALS
jgi:hypothetical protein